VRDETLVTLAWIVQRLKMGSVAYLNTRLYLLRQEKLREWTLGTDPEPQWSQAAAHRKQVVFYQLG
jgi:hypothetical protein